MTLKLPTGLCEHVGAVKHLFVKRRSAMQRFPDSLGHVPPLLPQAHQVGVQCRLAGRPPQLGDELPQGHQGGDQGGL